MRAIFTSLKDPIFKPINAHQEKLFQKFLQNTKLILVYSPVCIGYSICGIWLIACEYESHVHHVYRLPLKIWMPFDFNKTPNFEVAIILQQICLLLLGLTSMSMDSVLNGCLAHAAFQLKLLGNSLENLCVSLLH